MHFTFFLTVITYTTKNTGKYLNDVVKQKNDLKTISLLGDLERILNTTKKYIIYI